MKQVPINGLTPNVNQTSGATPLTTWPNLLGPVRQPGVIQPILDYLMHWLIRRLVLPNRLLHNPLKHLCHTSLSVSKALSLTIMELLWLKLVPTTRLLAETRTCPRWSHRMTRKKTCFGELVSLQLKMNQAKYVHNISVDRQSTGHFQNSG